jgi:PAS domain S-box-containing protein/putative nucleotidyltransferase with HDIG domain
MKTVAKKPSSAMDKSTRSQKHSRLAAQALRESEIRYRRLFEAARDGILILNATTGAITDVNPYLIMMLGYSREEFAEKKLWEVGAFMDVEASKAALLHLQQHEYIHYDNLPLQTKSGRLVQVEFVSYAYRVGRKKVIQCNIRDITERKHAEDSLRESEEKYRTLVETAEDVILLTDLKGRQLFFNKAYYTSLGFTLGEALELDGYGRVHPDDIPKLELDLTELLVSGSVQSEYRIQHKDGRWLNRFARSNLIYDESHAPRTILTIIRDITERKRAEERIQRQLAHFTALRDIDRTISASFDLQTSLNVVLNQVVTQLSVDAADVLLHNTKSQTLSYGAGRGFRTKAFEGTRLLLGEGYAGRAALERRTVHVPNLVDEPDNSYLTRATLGEGFISYYCVPLIAKGQILGVLEVFQRAPLDPDEEWLDFMQTLAGQAAIAIDNALLFDDLQRSNTELALAYDATIEGWSRALDLRDKETEGHTQRVTSMTVRLARVYGLSDQELVQVRWGALLHDIGKMGVPDSILLKPGPLTDDEWILMKKHPTFAYELLSSVRYLHAALDIPFRHHEKWDGTGYPLGLKGEEIPIAARIFAVVDVWDALSYNRPYRDAWTRERVLDYIQSLSGSHFDPQVVKVSLESRVFMDEAQEPPPTLVEMAAGLASTAFIQKEPGPAMAFTPGS